MALPDAHLFRPPCEVRAKIFGDASLSHPVFFVWKWKCQAMHRVGFKVTVPHAPRLSILLVCSGFYEKYLEDMDPNHRLLDIEWDGAIVQRRCLKKLIKNTKYTQAFVYAEIARIKMTSLWNTNNWDMTTRFIEVIQINAPRVSGAMIFKIIVSDGVYQTCNVP